MKFRNYFNQSTSKLTSSERTYGLTTYVQISGAMGRFWQNKSNAEPTGNNLCEVRNCMLTQQALSLVLLAN